jgi:hypothetical protein
LPAAHTNSQIDAQQTFNRSALSARQLRTDQASMQGLAGS